MADARRRSTAQPRCRASHSVLGEARDPPPPTHARLRAAVAGRAPDPAAVTPIDDWLTLAGSAATGARGGHRRQPDAVRSAVGLVAAPAPRHGGEPRCFGTPGIQSERTPLSICGSETCSARFYDRSPAGGAAGARWRSAATRQRQDATGRKSVDRATFALRLRRKPHTSTRPGDVTSSGIRRRSWFRHTPRSPSLIARVAPCVTFGGIDIEDLVGCRPVEQVWGLPADVTSCRARRRPSRIR